MLAKEALNFIPPSSGKAQAQCALLNKGFVHQPVSTEEALRYPLCVLAQRRLSPVGVVIARRRPARSAP